jgi:hypothetical protein
MHHSVPHVIGDNRNISVDRVSGGAESGGGLAQARLTEEDLRQVQNQVRQLTRVWGMIEQRVKMWLPGPDTDRTLASLRATWEE